MMSGPQHLLTTFIPDLLIAHMSYSLHCGRQAQKSARVALIPRNICGREGSSEYLLRVIRRRRRVGAVKHCAQSSVSGVTRLIQQTNNSED